MTVSYVQPSRINQCHLVWGLDWTKTFPQNLSLDRLAKKETQAKSKRSQKVKSQQKPREPETQRMEGWVEMMFLFNWVIFLLPALNFQGNHHFIFAKPGRRMLEDSKPTPKVLRWSLSLSSFLPPFLPRILESEKPTTQGQKPKSQKANKSQKNRKNTPSKTNHRKSGW